MARVVVALPLAPALLDELADHELTVLRTDDTGNVAFGTSLAEADGILVSSNVTVDRSVLASAPRLRVISTVSVGLDHIDLPEAADRGITVTNTPVLADAVADLTIALITMLSRQLPEAMRTVASGGWKVPLATGLSGKELLLVGFGRIGQAVATRALAADLRVRYVDQRDGLPSLAGVERYDALAHALPRADVVSLHIDLNATTRHLMGRPEFSAMRHTALLINTSRGAVVDQAALTWALTTGEIAGAGLDVLEVEPPAPDEPLLTLPHVVIVPHIGSATTETRQAMARCAIDNLRMVLSGEGQPFVVNAAGRS